MKNCKQIIPFLFLFSFAHAYEGPAKNNYTVTGTAQFLACDMKVDGPQDFGVYKFGPTEENFPFGLALFDNPSPKLKIMNHNEDDLCGIDPVRKVCAYMEIAIKTLPDGTDVMNVQTAVTSSNQRVTTENNYPITRFLDQERSFSQTANGCYRYELRLTVHQVR